MHNGHNTKNILAILSNRRHVQEIVLMSKYRLLKLYLGIEWHRISYGLFSLYIGINNRGVPTLWVFKNIANLSSKHGDFLFMWIYIASLDRYINTFWNNLVSRIAFVQFWFQIEWRQYSFIRSRFVLPFLICHTSFPAQLLSPLYPTLRFYGLNSLNWIVQVFSEEFSILKR